MNLVKIVIPIYKTQLTQLELLSLKQVYKILGSYPLVVIKPDKLDLSSLQIEFPLLTFQSFSDTYFEGIKGYNRLMLSKEFYKRFLDTDYILIYQLDTFVFRDELKEWCNKEYDYIGAPWLEKPIYRFPGISQFMWLSKLYHKLLQKPYKQALYNKIGNGGFSLRRVKSHYDITHSLQEKIKYYLSHPNNHFYNEDVFWATEPINFHYPPLMEAIHFAFDKYPAYCYQLINQQLPFGCHFWYKRKMKAFWKPIIQF